MSIAQKSIAVIAILAVVMAVFASFALTIQTAQAAVCPHTFSANLKMGQTSAEVMALQQFLNMDPATQVSATGAGSPGMETSYFGAKTKAAVVKFQNKYASDVLAPVGLTAGTGFFGASSRAKANALCSVAGPGPAPAPGTGLSVSAPAQPANSLAPEGASRVPFTKVTLTAGNDGDVVVDSIVVQRTGLGSNAAFSGVVLLDDMGRQLGTAKTFNSNNQATVGEKVTIPRGTSKTFTVAANMAASLDSYAGEAPAISVVTINTSATVAGSLPITGAYHTLNATLTVGSLSLDVSNAFAANSTVSKQLGTTANRASGFRLTAGSAEDVLLRTVRFNQTGSVSGTDLANVSVVVGGTAYPATWSSDGKYVEAILGSGVVISKGNNVEVYVQYDIVGSNSSNRTVIFDVDKTTDIYATGQTYGYGISPSTSGGSSVPTSRGNTTETTGTPYIYGNQITITGASVTTIAKDTSVAAQNIAINVPNQPLGGFYVDIVGEPITVQSMIFTVSSSSGSAGDNITNITLVDENGSVVAGPVDEADVANGGNAITFTDSVTFPTGKHKYTLRGKIATGTTGGATVTVSTNPSSGWTNVKGDITGNTITLTQGNFAMNAMTVKAGSISIGRATSPASQTIVPGGTSVLMTNFQFDAQQSGEDVRFSTAKVSTGGTGSASNISSCQLFDGATALNTGSNVLNPGSETSSTSMSITLDNPVTVAKGTVKTLGIRCNVSSSATNGHTYSWDVQNASNWTFTGATSGSTITGSDASDSAITVTIGAGTASVTTDASSPGYALAAAGTTDVPLGAFKFTATNENYVINQLGLRLSNSASSSAGDLVKVTIWDGATKVGEATFASGATTASSTLSTAVTVTKNTDKVLTIKGDLANVGTSESVTFSGHLLAVDFSSAEGIGQDSGNTVFATGSTAVSGVRIMKSYPTIAKENVTTNLAAGTLMRFKVTAGSAGPIGITNFALNLATSGVDVTNVDVFAYTDAGYSTVVTGISGDGGVQATDDCASGCSSNSPNLAIGITDASGTATVIQVPAGQTRYFEVKASVSGAASGDSVTTKLLGSSAFPTGGASSATANPLVAAGNAALSATADIIWSPNSTTTATRSSQDWTNGYGIAGLPSGGLISTVSQ